MVLSNFLPSVYTSGDLSQAPSGGGCTRFTVYGGSGVLTQLGRDTNDRVNTAIHWVGIKPTSSVFQIF